MLNYETGQIHRDRESMTPSASLDNGPSSFAMGDLERRRALHRR